MLRFPLIHPPLLAALGAAGHGGKVLLADANYSHSTNVSPAATVIAECRKPDLAVCVATGDDQLYSNVLLTIGYIRPSAP